MTKTETKLILITEKAKDLQLKFTSLKHLLDTKYLLACFKDLKQGKAAGIDWRTKESYATEEMEQTLEEAVVQMKTNKYRPQPAKRAYISKDNGEKRPLGIPTVIDKTIQLATKNILETIYEPLFLDFSYGFRPNRNPHQALKAVNHMIMQKKINWIIDADIENFFDNVDHKWIMECLSQRISDPRFKSLIYKFLKSGVMEEGIYHQTNTGTPQGGIISPILANIYLHYVLDLWFEKVVKKELNGEVELIRYADDFVIGLQHKDQAERLLGMLKERLAKFGLKLSEKKTSILEFGRFAKENHQKRGDSKPPTFDFLGFTHFCSTTSDGRFMLGAETSRKRQSKSLKNMNKWLKSVRNLLKSKDMWPILASKLQGHYNYYGISGNFESIQKFYTRTIYFTLKWLNRRSQKKSFYWLTFSKYLETYPLPKPKLMFQIYNTW